MAAVGENAERECRKLFTDCLLNAEVNNSYTLDEFKEFFPRKYRDHQDIKTLYDAYQTKRKQMRDTVLMNIRLHCRQREQEDNEVTDDKYKSDIEDLEAREQILQEEIEAMKQDIDLVKESIGSCADTLEKRRIFSDLERTDFDTRKLKKIKTRTSRRSNFDR